MRRVLLILAAVLVAGVAWLAYVLRTPYQGFANEGVFVEVPRRATSRSIARLLAGKGVIRNRFAFELWARWKRGQALQAGEYFFDRPRNTVEVFRWIAEGRIFYRTLVVREGYTMFQIADLIEKEGFASREEFLKAAGDPSLIRDLAPRARSLEGFLFPASYQMPRHPGAQYIVELMLGRFREAWAAAKDAPGASGRPVEEIVTLASLVEKETAVPDERALVAAVYVNRLRKGILLQCDPTVIYALELAGRYRGAIYLSDLRFNSPYNTYRHRGLPPGPIANPGEGALRAALAPAPVDYLYFVADNEGGHLFSRTLAEHNRNVARYRRMVAQNNSPATVEPQAAPLKPAKNNNRPRSKRS